MNKVLSPEEAIQLAIKLNQESKRIVLAGGCFDILHIGHITYLEEAKKQGDVLFVFVENDQSIKKAKGSTRPINTQSDRTQILAHLYMVDYVIKLAETTNYDELVTKIKPAIIAATKGDPNRSHKERQAKQIGAKVVDVTSQVSNQSTTKLISILNEI